MSHIQGSKSQERKLVDGGNYYSWLYKLFDHPKHRSFAKERSKSMSKILQQNPNESVYEIITCICNPLNIFSRECYSCTKFKVKFRVWEICESCELLVVASCESLRVVASYC